MCYKCQVCDGVVRSGPRRVHQITREVPKYKLPPIPGLKPGDNVRGEILREVPVCQSCKNQLDYLVREGMTPCEALRVVQEKAERARCSAPKYQVLEGIL